MHQFSTKTAKKAARLREDGVLLGLIFSSDLLTHVTPAKAESGGPNGANNNAKALLRREGIRALKNHRKELDFVLEFALRPGGCCIPLETPGFC